MKSQNVDREQNREDHDTRPDLFAGLWQDFATSSSWKLSNKTVNVSADVSKIEKVIWPKMIKC